MRFYDQETIRKNRRALIKGENINNQEIPKNIIESWLRSYKSGLDATIQNIPPQYLDIKTPDKITDYMRHTLQKNNSHYKKKHELLNQIEGAIFYLDKDLSVFNKAGNQKLLFELKRKGIRFGTNFSETLLGTNAAALAKTQEGVVWVLGEEHYLELFNNYATAAVSLKNPFFSKPFVYLIIVPISKYNDQTISTIDFIFSAEFYNSDYSQPTDVLIKKEILDSYMQQHQSALLIVDSQGIMLDINSLFKTKFEVNFDQVIGKQLNIVFPELSQTLTCIRTTKPLFMREVNFPHLPAGRRDYVMDCTPIKKENNCIGMVITLTDKNRITKYLGNLIGQTHFTFDSLIGNNINFLSTKHLAEQSAQSPSNILILGESGTGKELFAQAIHNASTYRNHPFVPLNCAAIPKELIGSELFGYEEGAFTGAKKGGAPGKFELANGGTLFLDEIAEMPLDMQSILLRVLEDRKVTRLGSSKTADVDVRIIAATNRNLWEYVNDGKFRLDLYYRLNVIKIELIPLRERKDDIPLLVDYFLRNFSEVLNNKVSFISPEAMRLLQEYSWPGNIRELRNVIERSVNLAKSATLTVADLPKDITGSLHNNKYSLNSQQTLPPIEDINSYENYEEREKEVIKYLLFKHHGNKSLVAQELGIARSTLYRKLKK